MKKLFILCAAMCIGLLTCNAQTTKGYFNVGPYEVNYVDDDDVRYRLRDNIDLYEFFDLQKDTTIVETYIEAPVMNAIQISGYVGANRAVAKNVGINGLWKKNVGSNLYFNCGLNLELGFANVDDLNKRTMFEAGIPLQIELGNLDRRRASLYGSFGIMPAFYTTLSAKAMDGNQPIADDLLKKSGFLVAPSLDFGGNIPLSGVIMRIGVYGTYKINCTAGDYDVYQKSAGRFFLGAKIGFVI